MIAEKQAFVYYEPTDEVISRSGDICVVAYCDQWYVKYGQEDWQKKILDHVKSDNFNSYNPSILKAFIDAIEWLKEWAVSRNFGAGTRVPWDPQFLIESLSDSTIYMSYYTIGHLLQGDLEGSKPGPLGIEAKQLTPEVYDYIYLKGAYKEEFGIPEEKLKQLRGEFEYWYPMDLRVSGKDLVRNHLTMSLYNHAAIWDKPEYWPRGFFCNGWITVDGEKMSKSRGNFLTLRDCIEFYGADATRIALADAGDTLDDANFVHDTANNAISRLANLDTWITFAANNIKDMRTESTDTFTQFIDKAFDYSMDQQIHLCD
jgi:leucyl-tRNA synthetase